MLLEDKTVYAVGYKKNDTDPWETSGKTFVKGQDAYWNAKELARISGAYTRVFKYTDLTMMQELPDLPK